MGSVILIPENFETANTKEVRVVLNNKSENMYFDFYAK